MELIWREHEVGHVLSSFVNVGLLILITPVDPALFKNFLRAFQGFNKVCEHVTALQLCEVFSEISI